MEETLKFLSRTRETGTIDPTLAALKYSIFDVHIQICTLFHMSENCSLLVQVTALDTHFPKTGIVKGWITGPTTCCIYQNLYRFLSSIVLST